MFNRLLIKVKFRYLALISILGLILNTKILFISLLFVYLKLYLKNKKIINLLLIYVFFSFFIFEVINIKFFFNKNEYYTESNIQYDIDKNYGYHPKKNSKFNEKIFFKKSLIKENNYLINEYGHRKTVGTNSDATNCIIFFGGSIVFGQSLNDDETLPYYVSKLYNDEAQVFNYAFNGYGPHQFLSKIENNHISEIKECKEISLIYFYINDHIGRVAGKRSWGDKSPRYIYDEENITQNNFFSSYPYKLIMKFRKNIRNSKIISIFYNIEKTNKKDQILLVKILKKIEEEFNNLYPSNNFYYIVWNKEKLDLQIVNNFFKAKKTLYINDLNIPKVYQSNNIPGDNHPKKEFNELLAKKIKKYLIN